MIDKATLEAKRAEYDAERVNAEQALLRLQGAIIALDELLLMVDIPKAEQLPLEVDA